MSDLDYLQWPFFDDRHRGLAAELDAWAAEHIPHGHGADVDAECRALVRLLGQAGWLRHAVGGTAAWSRKATARKVPNWVSMLRSPMRS
ncbi:hypothetical protein ACQCQS_26205, partial [Ralstonia pseudosolanacearum]